MRMPCLLVVSVALLALALAPAAARADDSVVVLGITSMEGDDEIARNLTGALRHSASQVHGWQVSDSEVTLAQMSLAHGCGDTPDPECLAQIASALAAQRLVYGLMRRDGDGFALSISVYDAGTGVIDRTVTERIPGSRTDIDDLRDPARSIIAQLSGPITGSLRIASNVPNATVAIDGSSAGTTDADGAFASSTVPVGEHEVTVSASGYDTWTGSITVVRGSEMTLDAPLVQSTGPVDGGGGGPEINWLGISLIGVGVAALGVSIYSWVRIDAIQSDPQYDSYLRGWPGEVPPNVCTAARSGMTNGSTPPATVVGMCDEADALEIVQYVFLGVAIASGAAGAVFLATGIGGGGGGEGDQAFMLTPSFSPDGARVSARLRF